MGLKRLENGAREGGATQSIEGFDRILNTNRPLLELQPAGTHQPDDLNQGPRGRGPGMQLCLMDQGGREWRRRARSAPGGRGLRIGPGEEPFYDSDVNEDDDQEEEDEEAPRRKMQKRRDITQAAKDRATVRAIMDKIGVEVLQDAFDAEKENIGLSVANQESLAAGFEDIPTRIFYPHGPHIPHGAGGLATTPG